MIDLMLSNIAPHICYACAEIGSPLCQSCIKDIENEDFGQCVWCLKPAHGTHQCVTCSKKTGVKGAWAVGMRETTLLALVDGYKFDACRQAVDGLVQLLDARLPCFDDDVVVTWVPTARSHVRERGFDHAARLAQRFAKRRRMTSQAFIKRRYSQSQHFLNMRQRAIAAQKTFECNRSITGPVLLMDDILTTGSTLRACIKVLQAAGASDVYVAVICTQPKR